MKKMVLSGILLFYCAALCVAGEDYRILVDKIFSRNPTRALLDGDYQRIKDMGFNVLSPRNSGVDVEMMERDLKLCREVNLKFLPWLRGTLDNTAAPEHQLTHFTGVAAPLYTPDCNEWLEYMRNWLNLYARKQKNDPAMLGVFLDFEHYAKPKIMEPYDYSYDRANLEQYRSKTGKSVISNGKRDADFEQWQKKNWQKQCAVLAANVKSISPDFKFFIYPAISTPFLEVFASEMQKQGLQVYNAGCETYDTPSFYSNEGIRDWASEVIRKSAAKAVSVLPEVKYLGGLDPAVRGNPPDVMELKMCAITENSSGYWIFFEGFTRDESIFKDYCDAFARANQAITNKTYKIPAEPKKATARKPAPHFKKEGAKKIFISHQMRGALTRYYESFPHREALDMKGAELDSIDNFDMLVLQNFSVMPNDRKHIYRELRNYVKKGGSIILSFSSMSGLPGLFPEIGKATATGKNSGPKMRHIEEKSPFLPGVSFSRYQTNYPYYYTFEAGEKGSLILKDVAGVPVGVGGKVGKGRVVMYGDFLGVREVPTGKEAQVIDALTAWLLNEKTED